MGSMTSFQTWSKGEIKISFEGRTKHVMKNTLDYDKMWYHDVCTF
jgi:hypothetical protein